MIRKLICLLSLFFVFSLGNIFAQQKEVLIYHPIQTDNSGNIVPWFNPDPAIAYDHDLHIIWNFWFNMRRDPNGLPYYMNHQVFNPNMDDPRGIGGDQFMMAMSSWQLYYAYTGDENVKNNLYFLAEYYLTHGLSPANCKWPDIPFPYNTLIYSGIYDGDMRSGKGVAQPDKAGSFGLELVHAYKIKNEPLFLDAAIKIANTLAANVKTGTATHSPLPFKVNVFTGKTALLQDDEIIKSKDTACYTSNLTPTLQLFFDLIQLKKGNLTAYKTGASKILTWLKKYPIQNNRWGPFFEDVGAWSQTQINGMTCARYMMEHPQYFPEWKTQVKSIINWAHTSFNNDKWKKYGVIVTNEQSIYPVPGESHTSRQGADELLYGSLTGDTSYYNNALRQLNWATYAVDFDGKNCFPFDEPWLTDGYGDYVRHYLRAMATYPYLAPAEDHILSSTSAIQQADYKGHFHKYYSVDFTEADSNKVRLYYRTFDTTGNEEIRLKSKPTAVLVNDKPLKETVNDEGYTWTALEKGGGVLWVRRKNGNRVIIE
ncbi:hypothetical protein [uncultured Mucilaginibacter sp.]|uniref:hypothetical protein n=1 Tax=uncultured Mucilaginibacter sp. TaxID=797541 RepID=UPI0025DE7C23|nr:hypothetical protein [uncultured Mucilaginibacter sp.]